MSDRLNGIGGSAMPFVAGLFALALLALGIWVGFSQTVDENTTDDVAAQQQIALNVTETTATPSEVIAPAPSFDEVRREPDGLTIIAGRAAPGSKVTLLIDGEALASARADAGGKFAIVTHVPPGGEGHFLTLAQGDGADLLVSSDGIILAPVSAPRTFEVADTIVPTETPAAVTSEEGSTATVNQIEPVATNRLATKPTAPAKSTSDPAVDMAVLKATEQGVELMNVPQPKVLTNVELDTISYSDDGDVQLAGRAQAGAGQVRVYLNNDSIISLAVDEQGRWRGDLPEVDAGIYTLRVDEVSETGDVISRVETPFKRESASVLAAATDGQKSGLRAVTVQKGDTLWAISRKQYGDGTLYVRLFNANPDVIRNPDLIYPGQVFDLPE